MIAPTLKTRTRIEILNPQISLAASRPGQMYGWP
jgi:hypothetical protein